MNGEAIEKKYVTPNLILRSMTIFRLIGGMPMSFYVDPDRGNIVFQKSKALLFWCAFAMIIYLSVPFSIFMALGFHSDLTTHPLRTFGSVNYMHTDIAAQSLLFIANFLSFLKFLSTMYDLPNGMNRYSLAISNLQHLVTINDRTEAARKGIKRVIHLSAWFMSVAFGYSASIYFIFDSNNMFLTIAVRLSIAISFGIAFLLSLFPLVPLFAVLLFTHSFSLCSQCIVRFHKHVDDFFDNKIKRTLTKDSIKIEELEESNDPGSKAGNTTDCEQTSSQNPKDEAMKTLLDSGHKVMDLIESIQDSFGNLVFDELLFSFIFSILGLYLGSTILFLSSGSKRVLSSLLSGICLSCSNAGVGIIYLFRLGYIVSSGQSIENKVSLLNSAIRRQMRLNYDRLTERDRFQLCILKERLTECKAIRPRRAFHLNSGMLISALGTAATYLFVLLQFKTGEDNKICH